MTNIHHSDDPRWQTPHVVDRVIIELTPGYDDKKFKEILHNHKAKERKHLAEINRHVVIVAPEEIQPLLDDLDNAGLLASSEPDGLLSASGGLNRAETVEFGDEVNIRAITPNDPNFPKQWHLPNIAVPDAWGITQGSASIKIAVIDSGAYSHPDLAPNAIAGYDFVNYDNNTTDTGALGGHGTATAGTAAAAINNGVGGAGVALCKFMPLVVLSSSDYAAWSDVADAITYAANHGCRIMNISIGGTTDSSSLDQAATYAWSKGCVIFASAMNNNNQVVNYPAGCQTVVAVAATNTQNLKASFSNYGSWVDIGAPGQNILTTYKTGSYANWSGTSFAAPVCAGVAALMWAANPTLSNTKLVNLMKQTADPVSGQPWGKVNALKAVQAAKAG